MTHDYTLLHPLEADPTLFHMNCIPFYLDEEFFHKEVTNWLGVLVKQKKSGVSYMIPSMAQNSSLAQILKVRTSSMKRALSTSISQKGDND
jgi:hypothetical protein